MGNAVSKTMWTERMYREREREVNMAMKAMKLTPVVATFDEQWCLGNLFQHTAIDSLLQEHTIWGLDVGYTAEQTKNGLHQLSTKMDLLSHDTWYHVVLKMGENFWVPRFRTNLKDDRFLFDLAKRREYVRLACVINEDMPVAADLSSMWVYPTLLGKTVYLLLTPNHLRINDSLTFIPSDNVHFLHVSKLETPLELQLRVKKVLESASRPLWRDIKAHHVILDSLCNVDKSNSESSESRILKGSSSSDTEYRTPASPKRSEEGGTHR